MRWYWWVIIGLGGGLIGIGAYAYVVARDIFRRLG